MLKIKEKKLSELIPYIGNAKKHPASQIAKIAGSIKEFGFLVPALIKKNGEIICGHGRILAAESAGLQSVPCIVADGLSDLQVKAFRIAENRLAESSWDNELLAIEMQQILDADYDIELIGFEDAELKKLLGANYDIDEIDIEHGEEDFGKKYEEGESGALRRDYIVPPFSVLDGRAGYWMERKKKWLEIGLRSHEGRIETMKSMEHLAQRKKGDPVGAWAGTSIFDPVLCEILLRWFCPNDGHVLDPYAGGSVRGIISGILGRKYTGVDIRPEQVEANFNNLSDISEKIIAKPDWIIGNSSKIDDAIENEFDFVFSCPPYFSLEKYSDLPGDISNMPLEKFREKYTEAIVKSCAMLRENRFAAFVVGDVREKGVYIDFPGITIEAFREAGLCLYNNAVYLTVCGTAALRARGQFGNRKLVNTHQQVLVFYKGDIKKISENFPAIPESLNLCFLEAENATA